MWSSPERVEMAGGPGFEPGLTGPEPVVLPLDDPPEVGNPTYYKINLFESRKLYDHQQLAFRFEGLCPIHQIKKEDKKLRRSVILFLKKAIYRLFLHDSKRLEQTEREALLIIFNFNYLTLLVFNKTNGPFQTRNHPLFSQNPNNFKNTRAGGFAGQRYAHRLGDFAQF